MPLRKLIRDDTQVEAYFRVRCGHARHWLAVINGSLVPLNHNLRATRAIIELGGRTPFCLELLNRWKFRSPLCFPTSIRDYHNKLLAIRDTRYFDNMGCHSWLAAEHYDVDHGWAGNDERKLKWLKIFQCIRLLLMYRCEYWCLKMTPWRLVVQTYNERHPSNYTKGVYVTHPPHQIVKLQVDVVRTWLSSVWSPGLAVIEKKLVLNFKPHVEDGRFESGVATLLVEPEGAKDIVLTQRPAEVAKCIYADDTRRSRIIRWL